MPTLVYVRPHLLPLFNPAAQLSLRTGRRSSPDHALEIRTGTY